MKIIRLLVLIALVVLAAGCDFGWEFHTTLPFDNQSWDIDVPEDINSLEATLDWVFDNVEYRTETDDYWQSPEETLALGYGDCEDFSVLVLYILQKRTNIIGKIIIGKFYERRLGDNHVWIEVNDEWYEAVSSNVWQYNKERTRDKYVFVTTYSYRYVMSRVPFHN